VAPALGYLVRGSSTQNSFTKQLTRQKKYAIGNSVMKNYSTLQVARMVGVHKVTLQRWLLNRKVAEPRRISDGGVIARVWTDRDVERVRKYKEQNYRKGRGRKPKPKR
jgi:IS30 family transposase